MVESTMERLENKSATLAPTPRALLPATSYQNNPEIKQLRTPFDGSLRTICHAALVDRLCLRV